MDNSRWLDGHLSHIEQVVLDYLHYEDRKAKQPDDPLAAASQETPPDIPDVLTMVRRCHFPERLPYPGAWVDQPYLIYMELETCIGAVNLYNHGKIAAAQLFEQQGKDGTQR